MYINLSYKKILIFISFIGSVTTLLIITILFKNNLPLDYVSSDKIAKKINMSIENFYYKTKFSSINNNNLFASTILALNKNVKNNYQTDDLSFAKSVPVLVYHGIVDKPDRFSMSQKTFADQMFALKKAGYNTVTENDFEQFILGKKELPKKSFLLTFDDGRRDSYEGADPILSSINFNAIMFVATGDSLRPKELENDYYLNEDTLRNMVKTGRWELGSHAIQKDTYGGEINIDSDGNRGNFLSNLKWLNDKNRLENIDEYKKRIVNELVGSKNELEDDFGITVNVLSYPFSDYGEETVNNPFAVNIISSIMKENYSIAFQQVNLKDGYSREFLSNSPYSDSYHLMRLEVPTNWNGSDLVGFLNKNDDKSLPFTDDFLNDTGWSYTWGNFYISSTSLKITSLPDTTGGFVFLGGTKNWQNYMYRVGVSKSKGSHISLVARYNDQDNYLSCIFGDGYVKIEKKINGQREVISSIKNYIKIPESDTEYGIMVDNNLIKCYEGNKAVSYAFSSDIPKSGGVGLQIWDAQMDNAYLEVNSFEAVDSSDALNLKKRMPSYAEF